MTSFDLDLSKYNLGWSDSDVEYAFKPRKGLDQGVVDEISWWKGEPTWMTQFRQRSLRLFDKKPMADWFADRKSTRLNSSHVALSRMPSSA